MGIPNKALRASTFTYLNDKGAVIEGSHQTSEVSFKEEVNGVEFIRRGFFKKIEPKGSYPEFLARISVGISSCKQSFLGKRTAEERLVFDDHDVLVGSFSFAIDGFQPLNFAHEKVPEDPKEKEKVLPSTQTLIDANEMELLIANLLAYQDDLHGHNLSLAGDIDNDMCLYWFTKYMKSERLFISSPDLAYISAADYAGFPIVKEFKPFHWVTYRLPGENSLPEIMQNPLVAAAMYKVNGDPQQFINLASDPRAQDQKIAAVLKALLTYQPELQRRKLAELFGNMPLNYTSLDEKDPALRIKYEKLFPELCNNTTNKQPFIDFMMRLYKERYDNLYRVFVFFIGCDNNGAGLELPATSTSLYKRPSFYTNIKDWVENENKTTYADDKNAQYSLTELNNRYHQIWRDAFASRLRELIRETNNLTNDVWKLATDTSVKIDLEPVLGKDASDFTFVNSSEFFGDLNNISVNEQLISIADDSRIRGALSLLASFTNELKKRTDNYYGKTHYELTDADNLHFCNSINTLLKNYCYDIKAKLAHTTTEANRFAGIYDELSEFAKQMDFQMHLLSKDEQMLKKRDVYVRKEQLPHTHPEIMKQFNENLFLWVKELTPEVFNRYVNDIIDKKYTPAPTFSLFSMRQRTQPVKEYLRASKESNVNKLAHILSSGKEEGALNTLLLQDLAPMMLQHYPLPSVSDAIRNGQFGADLGLIAKSTIDFAKTDKQFTHLYSVVGMEQFYKAFYHWVGDSKHLDKIKRIKSEAITQYEEGLSYFSMNSRKSEVNGYFMALVPEKAIASTFMNGEKTSTLSLYLFLKLIKAIKEDIHANPSLKESSGYQLIDQFSTGDEAHPDQEQLFFKAYIGEHPVTKKIVTSNASSKLSPLRA